MPVARYPHLLGFCFFIFLFHNHHAHAQVTKLKSGIRFEAGDFKAALAKARNVNKPVFVEVYLTGCPHCDALAPVLEEKAVGDFYNANFISWKTEANSKESAAFQKDKGVTYPEFPLFFFFDANGDLIHTSNPAEHTSRQEFIQEVITHGKTALSPLQRTGSYPARFASGDRDLMFLIGYGKYSKAVKDQQKLTEINNELGKILVQPQDITGQAGFFVLSRLMNDYRNPLAQYFFGHLDEFKSKYVAKDVQGAGEAILYHTLYGPAGDSFSVDDIVKMRMDMGRLGISPADASARLLIKELDAYLRAKNTPGAVNRFNEYRKQVPNLALADYAYLMKYFNEKAPDQSYLAEMPVWAAAGLKAAKKEEQNSKIMAGLYLELSEAYHKMGHKDEAKKYADQCLQTAKAAKEDLTKYNQQVARVQ